MMLQKYSRLYTALEAPEILKKDWDDMIILPPGKVYSLTDEKEVNNNIEKSSKLPFDIAGLVEIDNTTLMLTSYHSLSRTRMFWEKEDLKVEAIK